jgi:hypothetical protein
MQALKKVILGTLVAVGFLSGSEALSSELFFRGPQQPRENEQGWEVLDRSFSQGEVGFAVSVVRGADTGNVRDWVFAEPKQFTPEEKTCLARQIRALRQARELLHARSPELHGLFPADRRINIDLGVYSSRSTPGAVENKTAPSFDTNFYQEIVRPALYGSECVVVSADVILEGVLETGRFQRAARERHTQHTGRTSIRENSSQDAIVVAAHGAEASASPAR